MQKNRLAWALVLATATLLAGVTMAAGAPSPLAGAEIGWIQHWDRLAGWFDAHLANWRLIATRLLGVLFIVILAYIARGLLLRILRRVEAAHGGQARFRSLLPMARNVANVVIAVVALLTILPMLGINIVPLLAGAGVLGIAVGFGAQTLAKDIITGIFIVLEDAIAVGDFITVGSVGGVVEGVSLRTVKIRDGDGQMHIIPFSTVDRVTNLSREFGYAKFSIGVGYRENPDRVMALIAELGEELAKDPVFGPDLLEPLEVWGLDSFDDSAVVYVGRVKTRPLRQFAVRRELHRRVKLRFDAENIEFPFPSRTLYWGEGKPPAEFPAFRTDSPAIEPGPQS